LVVVERLTSLARNGSARKSGSWKNDEQVLRVRIGKQIRANSPHIIGYSAH